MRFEELDSDDIEHMNQFLEYLEQIGFDFKDELHKKLCDFLLIKEWFSKNEYEFIQGCEQKLLIEIIISKCDDILNFFGGRVFVQNGSHNIQQINFEEVEKEKDFFEESYLKLYQLKVSYQKIYAFNEEFSFDQLIKDVEFMHDSYYRAYEIEEKITNILVEKCITNKDKKEDKKIESSMYH